MNADLVAETWATIRDRPDAAGSCPAQVMENLAAFQADPCASGWYGFVVRLGVLVHPWEVHGLLGDRDPFPAVTALALADAKLAREAAASHEA
jgi:hypothetical protein